jgi:hypothetical protein
VERKKIAQNALRCIEVSMIEPEKEFSENGKEERGIRDLTA